MTSGAALGTGHAVVLAGGLGTRIQEALGSTPKALADVGGLPFIERKLGELEANGVRSATLLLGRGADEVTDYLGTRPGGLAVSVVLDGRRLRGTGGALLNALPGLPDDFYVTYGDSLLEMRYADLDAARRRASKPCALAVTEAVGDADTANCELADALVVRHSKQETEGMTATDYGVMLLRRDAVRQASRGLHDPVDLSVILARLAESRSLAAAVTTAGYWEIGTPATLARVRARFAESSSPRPDA